MANSREALKSRKTTAREFIIFGFCVNSYSGIKTCNQNAKGSAEPSTTDAVSSARQSTACQSATGNSKVNRNNSIIFMYSKIVATTVPVEKTVKKDALIAKMISVRCVDKMNCSLIF